MTASTAPAALSLRPATPADEHLLTAFFRNSRPVFAALGPAATDALVRMQRQAQQASWTRTRPMFVEFLIEQDGVTVGSVVVDDHQQERHILDICVEPEHRGRGTGTAVLRRLCDDMPGAVSLWVAADNPARSLYERLGFHAVDATATDTFMRRPAMGSPT